AATAPGSGFTEPDDLVVRLLGEEHRGARVGAVSDREDQRGEHHDVISERREGGRTDTLLLLLEQKRHFDRMIPLDVHREVPGGSVRAHLTGFGYLCHGKGNRTAGRSIVAHES